ncbi:MAG TPA: hypothetical protein PKY77_00480 [Phycisphaerae bacterium]|nr:hypothetical protein [Phycisphaerae bacterium]HRY67671.1 hypothetical protein [Phycisphaerae bacterium]HSA25058.1 hypothetical protein [Phycisphaerae bacterium]
MGKPALMVLVALVLVAGPGSPAVATDWVLDRDFSKGPNPNGQWTYGVYLEDALNPSYPDGWYTWPAYYDFPGTDAQIGYWGNPGGDLGAGAVFYTNSDAPLGGPVQWWAPRKVMLHPAAIGGGYAPVIRWTAPSDMRVSVDALFYGCENATTDVHILLNGTMYDGPSYTGTHLLDGVIDGNYGYAPLGIPASGASNSVGYNGVLDLMAGDKLDFVCGYGGNGYAGDLTGLDVTITKLADLTVTDWVLDRDFAKGANPHRQWTYGVYLADSFDPAVYPDGSYTWPAYYDWPGSNGQIGYWGNPGGDLNAGCVFYTNSDVPQGGPVQWWAPHKVMLHPAAYGDSYAPMIRWTAPADMTVSVDALFYGCEETTTDVHILLNGTMNDGPVYIGTSLLDGVIDGNYGYAPLGIAASGTSNHVAYNEVLTVAAGDKLDFVVNFGPNAWFGGDLTGLDVTIARACNSPWADADGDSDVDQADFGVFQTCFTGSTPGGSLSTQCRCFDRAGERGAITGEDFSAFAACWTGPTIPSAACP